MTELPPLQHQLLRQAATGGPASDGGQEDASPAKTKAAIKALIKAGLLLSIPIDGAPSRLMITEAGRAALEPPKPDAPEAPEPPTAEAETEAEPDGASEAATPPPEPKTKTKLDILIALLGRPEGADLQTMMTATGWQAHSVRGAIAGGIRKKIGQAVLSEKTEAGRIYRIPAEA